MPNTKRIDELNSLSIPSGNEVIAIDDTNNVSASSGFPTTKKITVNDLVNGISTTIAPIAKEVPVKLNATDFQLSYSPILDTELVFLNGVLQEKGATEHYTISADIITFITPTTADDEVVVAYIKDDSASATASITLQSPDGQNWELTISNSGALVTNSI